MLLTYFLNDFEMVPIATIITGITLFLTFHVRCISIVRPLYYKLLLLLLLCSCYKQSIISQIVWLFCRHVICLETVYSRCRVQKL